MEDKKKQGWNELNFKTKIIYTLAITAFIIGWGLTVAGFIVSPLGQVHPSVLTALGTALVFVSTVFGISAHYSTELKKFENAVLNNLNADGGVHNR